MWYPPNPGYGTTAGYRRVATSDSRATAGYEYEYRLPYLTSKNPKQCFGYRTSTAVVARSRTRMHDVDPCRASTATTPPTRL
eukprot:scaffold332052_cov22-Prasinocladus_malaysianus.AAC.1